MRFSSAILPLALIAGSSALKPEAFKETEDGFAVITAECASGYWDCLTNCPLFAPPQFCITWPATCAIIYC
ncbi:hypothetical protein BJY04DRAFT_199120 [Aspergillus karnatakaensis]|uniref:uncharacterized protein n=1 Tax=Aspergillus karnatakaensis TaxID=1810916 RepID=UPI003CCDA802